MNWGTLTIMSVFLTGFFSPDLCWKQMLMINLIQDRALNKRAGDHLLENKIIILKTNHMKHVQTLQSKPQAEQFSCGSF